MAEAILYSISNNSPLYNGNILNNAVNNDNRMTRFLDEINDHGIQNVSYRSITISNSYIVPYLFAFTAANHINLPYTTKIGKGAFYSAYNNLSLIYIGSEVSDPVTICDYAFYNCSNLRNCIINNCNYVGKQAFAQCISLNGLNYTSMFDNISYIGERAFENCGLTYLSIGNVNAQIDDYAFANNHSIGTIQIYCSSINSTIFYNCTNLQTVLLFNINKLDPYTFNNAHSRINTLVMSECERIEGPNFISCFSSNDTTVYIPKCSYIGKNTFMHCGFSNIGGLTATYIDDQAFYDCSSLTNLTLSETTYIGESAFYGCTSLSGNLNLIKCNHIGNWAFYGAHPDYFVALSLSKFPETFAGNDAAIFSDLKGITLYNMPIISAPFFMNRVKLSKVTISNCNYIEPIAFINCSLLTDVQLYGDNVIQLQNINTFQDTNESLIITVPSELYTNYINDSVWRLLSSRISSRE